MIESLEDVYDLLSVRSYAALKKIGITTIGEFAKLDVFALHDTGACGPFAIHEMRGLQLRALGTGSAKASAVVQSAEAVMSAAGPHHVWDDTAVRARLLDASWREVSHGKFRTESEYGYLSVIQAAAPKLLVLALADSELERHASFLCQPHQPILDLIDAVLERHSSLGFAHSGSLRLLDAATFFLWVHVPSRGICGYLPPSPAC